MSCFSQHQQILRLPRQADQESFPSFLQTSCLLQRNYHEVRSGGETDPQEEDPPPEQAGFPGEEGGLPGGKEGAAPHRDEGGGRGGREEPLRHHLHLTRHRQEYLQRSLQFPGFR